MRGVAAAQYGSGAIAGVINFQLNREREDLTFATRYGQYYAGDGEDLNVQMNLGLPLADGFLNFSAEWMSSDPTAREAQRPDARALIAAGNTAVPNPAQRWGNIESEAHRLFVNAELPVTENVDTYLFANYSASSGAKAFGYRSPEARPDIFTSVPLAGQPGGERFSFRSQFPVGFTPTFGTQLRYASATAGAKGQILGALSYDFSSAMSQNEIEYRDPEHG